MPRVDNLYELPADLPVPRDDGACDQLVGMRVPSIPLLSTSGTDVRLDRIRGEWAVIFCYPRTGKPGEDLLPGWNDIPGARGCTPESCGFRDRHDELQELGVTVFGLSTQDTADQREAVERLTLPFQVLSDAGLAFATTLNLPTFQIEGLTLIKRLTLVLRDGRIEKVFYPIFPPDTHATEVVGWFRNRAKST